MPSTQHLSRNASPRDAKLACGMSMFLPGLGQLYNQEPRKATLFMAAGAVNYLFILALLLMSPLMHLLNDFGKSNQVRLNSALAGSLSNLHAGSGAFLILLSLFFAFALFAARDAYDKAQFFQRKALNQDHFLEMPEATSGSYLFHISILLSCLILAFFFLIPPAPREQMTVFEFKQSVENARENKKAIKFSDHAARAGGVRDVRRPPAVAKPMATTPRAVTTSQPAVNANQSQSAKAEPTPLPKPNLQPVARLHTPLPELKPVPVPVPVPSPVIAPMAAIAKNPVLPAAPPMMPTPVTNNHPGAVSLPAVTTSGASAFVAPRAPTASSADAAPGASGPVKIASANPGSSGAPVPLPVGARSGSPSSSSSSSSSSGPAPTSGSPARGPGALGPVLHKGGREKAANFDGDKEKEGNDVTVADFGPYMIQLQARIKRNWFPPKIGRTKRVKVIFNISRDGQLSRLRLVQTSGLTISDQAAFKAVEAAAPFMPLPKGAPADVDIEFTFDYNVFNGGGAPSGSLQAF